MRYFKVVFLLRDNPFTICHNSAHACPLSFMWFIQIRNLWIVEIFIEIYEGLFLLIVFIVLCKSAHNLRTMVAQTCVIVHSFISLQTCTWQTQLWAEQTQRNSLENTLSPQQYHKTNFISTLQSFLIIFSFYKRR